MDSLDRLTRILHYQFRNKKLLEAALTHRSVRGDNNERLEFLGDALLNFFIAEHLYVTFANGTEGELSRLRASLVKGDTLADIAREFKLGDFLRLGPGELKSGGFTRHSILADALEAIMGAIYLDSDIETCRQCVLTWYAERFKGLHLDLHKDAKTRLQEYLQSRRMPLPKYEILQIVGEAHAQEFHVSCSVDGLPHVTHSVATTRRKAEQLAADEYLLLLKV